MNNITESALGIPTVAHGNKIAVVPDALGRKVQIMGRFFEGSCGGNISSGKTNPFHIAVDVPLTVLSLSKPPSIMATKTDVNVVEVPLGSVQLHAFNFLNILTGKTITDYVGVGYFSEWGITLGLYQELPDGSLTFRRSTEITGTNTFGNSYAGDRRLVYPVGGSVPIAAIPRIDQSNLSNTIINIPPGVTHIKYELTSCNLPNIGVIGTLVRVMLIFMRQGYTGDSSKGFAPVAKLKESTLYDICI